MKRIIHILIVALVAFTFTAGASRAVAETPAEQVEAAKVGASESRIDVSIFTNSGGACFTARYCVDCWMSASQS